MRRFSRLIYEAHLSRLVSFAPWPNIVVFRSMTRFIFITGGVVSSLGKGLASASLALLQARGFKVRLRLDPYLTVDPGTMSLISMERSMSRDGAETTWIWVIMSDPLALTPARATMSRPGASIPMLLPRSGAANISVQQSSYSSCNRCY